MFRRRLQDEDPGDEVTDEVWGMRRWEDRENYKWSKS